MMDKTKYSGDGRWDGLEVVLIPDYQPNFNRVEIMFVGEFPMWSDKNNDLLPYYVGSYTWEEAIKEFANWRVLAAKDCPEESCVHIVCGGDEFDSEEIENKA